MPRALLLCLAIAGLQPIFAQNPFSKAVKKLEKVVKPISSSNPKNKPATLPNEEVEAMVSGTGELTPPTPESALQLVGLNYDKGAYPWTIGQNLLLDLGMKGYENYFPQWRNITTLNPISFTVTNSQRESKPGKDNGQMSMFVHDQQAYVHVEGAYALPCDCVMPVLTPAGKAVIIGTQPQTFTLGPCRMLTSPHPGQYKVSNEPCVSDFSLREYESRLTLQITNKGGIGFALEIQRYAPANNNRPRRATSYYTTGMKTVANRRPPERYVYELISQQPETEHLTRLFHFLMDQIMIEHSWFFPKNLPSTLQIENVQKDKAGTITEATASFLCSVRNIAGTDSIRHKLMVRFDKGVPYRIFYPGKDIPDHSIRSKIMKDSLSFTRLQSQRIAQLNKDIDDRYEAVFEANRKRSWDSVMRKQATYKGEVCSDCLVKRIECHEISYIEVTERIGEQTEKVEKSHVICDAYLKNKSTKSIRVIGIGKKYDYRRGFYYTDVSYVLKPGQEHFYSSGGIGINASGEYPVYMSGKYDESEVSGGMSQWFKVVYQQ